MRAHEAIARRLSALAEEFTEHRPLPGGVIIAVSRDALLFELPFGLANVDARIPMAARHLFEIGSISKIFVSLMANQLAEQGKLDLDRPITTYLPWFKAATPYPMFTARHLLQHTSGLVTGADALPDEIGQAWWMRELPVGSAPGSFFHYSNIGYILLGLVITAVAGDQATSVCRTQILEPLGMANTIPCVINEDRPRLAVGYAPAHDDRPWVPGDALAPATWFEVNGADGNIAASGGDMGRFMRMLLKGGEIDGRRIISATSFAEMTTSLAPGGEPIVGFLGETGVEDSRYGLGINIETIRGSKCLSHGGGMVGYATFLLADPEHDVAIAVLTNANGDCPAAQVIARIGHAWLTGAPLSPPAPDLRLKNTHEAVFDPHMVGSFTGLDQEIIIAVDKKDGGLTLNSGGVAGRLFRTWTARFVTDHPGFRLFHLTFESADDGPQWIHGGRIFRQGPATPEAIPERLRSALGHYRSHSPWFTNFRIVGRGDRLFLIAPGGVEAPSEDVELIELSPGIFRIGRAAHLPERLILGPEASGRVVTVDRDGNRYSRTFTL